MVQPNISDTSLSVRRLQQQLIAALTPAERLNRALRLSALARAFAWAGAGRVAGDRGPDAVRHRFLEQVYGGETAAWVASRIAVSDSQ